MKKMILVINMFQASWQLDIYENGNKINEYLTTADKAPEDIVKYALQHDLKSISIKGPKHYSNNFKQKILTTESNKYNENRLEINLI